MLMRSSFQIKRFLLETNRSSLARLTHYDYTSQSKEDNSFYMKYDRSYSCVSRKKKQEMGRGLY